MLAQDLVTMAQDIVANFTEKQLRIATAEGCTGGMISAILTAIPGASAVVERGFIVYSTDAKEEMVGVSASLISNDGAVSEAVARTMAEGAIHHSKADIAIATTGIGGPNGATEEKPVGLVYIALAARDADSIVEKHLFEGNRNEIRHQTVLRALTLLKHFGA